MPIRGSNVPVTENPRQRAPIIILGLLLLVLVAWPSLAFGEESAAPQVKLTPANTLVCAGGGLYVEFGDVPNLYGYEFKITYDVSLAEAGGAFLNHWFDTETGVVPPGWDGQCAGGVCRFAASLLNPATPLSGGGVVATVNFRPRAAGTFQATLTDLVLSDIDGFPIAAGVEGAPLTFVVCGQAAISGRVSLQGRPTPLDGGHIMLVDSGGDFPDINATFGDDGAYAIANIPVLPSGSTYMIWATHHLYLGNEKALWLTPGQHRTGQDTQLLGGDANNSGLHAPFTEGVDISDVACIAAWFRHGPGGCGPFPGSNTDINKDALTNIQDLALAAGNYRKDPFQPW
jgi:hypothetical protein